MTPSRDDMTQVFDASNFDTYCETLADREAVFRRILDQHGRPPLWQREPNFTTLVRIILEQQVSLASANATFTKLTQCVSKFTPDELLQLSTEDMRACAVSRQKTRYLHALSDAVLSNQLNIPALAQLSDDVVRQQLTQVKGIGQWTANVFLMLALNRTDCFPSGDVALNNSLRHEFELSTEQFMETSQSLIARWAPLRTIAAYLLWHAYIQRKNITFAG
ncbi:DNA-3-methyladenine glycosylase family protein [Thalassoroseus pseudoceratinae]|uniref:DNA-3-methyladenine glycosylase family protein n=1 Tax=Thalassoroseus pseudoceratinae TaxID=2713176 RepID=UPI00198227C0|nr:DNA-3-methyladenine glycosylase 2 family protein [Thalassoroseus pseudoceratinae]